MSELLDRLPTRRQSLPTDPACADCGSPLSDRYGWCGGCRTAHCLPCGRAHFCAPTCPTAGCIAGLCVRLVEHGRLSDRWGLPPDA